MDLDSLLRHLVRSAAELVGAEYAAMGVLDRSGTHLAEFVIFGIDEDLSQLIGSMPQGHGLLGEVIRSHTTVRVDNLEDRPDSVFPRHHPHMKNFLGTQVRTGDGKVFGNLYLANKNDGAFTDEDDALLATLGRATGLIIDQTRMREQVRSFTLLEERNRLARDLHDSVIQRLFAVGLSLQASLMAPLPEATSAQINVAIDELDTTIREIRTTIFEISHSETEDQPTLRSSILSIIDEVPSAAGLHIDVTFDGSLDTGVGPECRNAVEMSLREMLSNVVRHAQATRAIVTVVLDDRGLEVTVEDNGVGLTNTDRRGRGLVNLADRAHAFDGSFSLQSHGGGGGIATWSAGKVKK